MLALPTLKSKAHTYMLGDKYILFLILFQPKQER